MEIKFGKLNNPKPNVNLEKETTFGKPKAKPNLELNYTFNKVNNQIIIIYIEVWGLKGDIIYCNLFHAQIRP
jgi:hypothetical protein